MSRLSPRSIVASLLLGSDPPRLPGSLLVAFADQFGIQAGTTRTALSRMVERGELQRHADGGYELKGALLQRRRHQETLLAPVLAPWDGRWEIRVIPAGRRTAEQRAAMRQLCTRLTLWERRDGVWMRPANLRPDRLPEVGAAVERQSDGFVAVLDGDPKLLINQLVDLDSWAEQSQSVIAELEQAQARVGEPGWLAEGFVRSVAALRHLLSDPLLPPELAPNRWPAAELRQAYHQHLETFQNELRAFFRSELSGRSGRGRTRSGSTVEL